MIEVDNGLTQKDLVLNHLKRHPDEFFTPAEIAPHVENISVTRISAILGKVSRRNKDVVREKTETHGYKYAYTGTEEVKEPEEVPETSEEDNKTLNVVADLEAKIDEYRAALAQRVSIEGQLNAELADLRAEIKGMSEKNVSERDFERENSKFRIDLKKIDTRMNTNESNIETLYSEIVKTQDFINEMDTELWRIRRNNLLFYALCVVAALALLFILF